MGRAEEDGGAVSREAMAGDQDEAFEETCTHVHSVTGGQTHDYCPMPFIERSKRGTRVHGVS